MPRSVPVPSRKVPDAGQALKPRSVRSAGQRGRSVTEACLVPEHCCRLCPPALVLPCPLEDRRPDGLCPRPLIVLGYPGGVGCYERQMPAGVWNRALWETDLGAGTGSGGPCEPTDVILGPPLTPSPPPQEYSRWTYNLGTKAGEGPLLGHSSGQREVYRVIRWSVKREQRC